MITLLFIITANGDCQLTKSNSELQQFANMKHLTVQDVNIVTSKIRSCDLSFHIWKGAIKAKFQK